MSVQLIAGRAGSGKTTRMIQQAAEIIKNQSDKNIIFLVPDQMTFQMENYFLHCTDLPGMMNVQVYGFSYLAFRVLQEVGGLSQTFLSQSGMEMLVRQVIRENKEHLSIFKQAAQQKGFYRSLIQLFKELKQYEITETELMSQSTTIADVATANKLADASLLYQQYQEKLVDKYVESEDYLRLLSERGGNSWYLKNSLIFIDGFEYFSTQELSVIEMLFKTCSKVFVNITLKTPPSLSQTNEFDMFQMNEETYFALEQIIELNHLSMERPIFLTENKRTKKKELHHLEDNWGNTLFKSYSAETEAIQIHQANNPRSELEGIARQVKDLLVTKNYQYKDMAVLLRHVHGYEALIETVMAEYEIPYFLDKKRSMGKHPFIEFIRSTMDTIKQNWQYQSLFQTARTEFFFPIQKNTTKLRNKLDVFENYLLENGIYNKTRWFQSEHWIYRKIRGLETNIGVQTDEELAIEEIINEMRILIQKPLLHFEKALEKAKTATDFALALYDYLQFIEAPEHLEHWRQNAEKENLFELSREHEQAWNEVIKLLEEFVDIIGETEISRVDFFDIVSAGLDALEFSLLPPALDQLIITDMDNARLLDMKIIFAAGLNDGNLPIRIEEKGIFSNKDRECLVERGMKLKPTSEKLLIHEEFLAYRLFSLPSDYLFLSYPAADLEGKLLPESIYLRRLKTMFPNLKEKMYLTDPSLLTDSEQSSYISAPKSSLGILTNQLQMYKRGYQISPVWWDLYNYLLDQGNSDFKSVLSSLNYHNNTTLLSEETATALFGEKINASVSRMEKFFSCGFQHYAQYGLKLEERATFQLQSVDMGDIFHGAMEWISKKLQQENMDWGRLTIEECQLLANQAMDYLAPKLQHQILLSTSRMAYIKYKLLNIIIRATTVLNEQAKASAFRPLGLEVNFGLGGAIPPLKIPLKQNHELMLQGRIDRIDQAEEDGRTFLRIIDYKSSSHDLSLNEIYYGLALQMLTYLDVVVTNASKLIGKTAEPAGVLYFHMHNQLVNADMPLSDEELAKELKKSYRMKGILLADPLAITLMDNQLDQGGASLIIPAEVKKDGKLSARSKTANKSEFDIMRCFVQKKYKEAGDKILDGDVAINPYKLNETTPCQFCVFRSLCQFDPAINNNQYRYLKNEKSAEVINKMREEEGEENE